MEPIRSVERNFISNELLHAIVLIHEQTSAIGIQAFFKTAVTASQVDGDFLVTAPWSLLHPYTSGDVMRDNTTGNPRSTDFPVASFMQRSIVEDLDLHFCTEVQVLLICPSPIRPPWTVV